ncbi:hypothetical protein RBB75_07975 [Tunturibacter empetritectus]|uniref:Uncharacterized protein n=1 Tax=Tunturiibacter empetritectus TaxID=3069691 RepID=A0AAU7ZI28_9BACT
MKFYPRGYEMVIGLASILLILGSPTVAQQKPSTFEMTVSLPEPTMHVGEDLIVKVITSNSTDDTVSAGSGYGVGVEVELMNNKGEDIGIHAMGGKGVEPVVTLHTNKLILKPHSKDDFTWRFKPEPGFLMPGVYRLRVHRRDLKSRMDVYSNTVVLTVVP